MVLAHVQTLEHGHGSKATTDAATEHSASHTGYTGKVSLSPSVRHTCVRIHGSEDSTVVKHMPVTYANVDPGCICSVDATPRTHRRGGQQPIADRDADGIDAVQGDVKPDPEP